MKFISKIFYFTLLLSACSQAPNDKVVENVQEIEPVLFKEISAERSGVTFNNKLTETQQLNYMMYDGMYQGAGVAVGDFNNDGLPDLYFAGNMSSNKLYLNKGNLQFEDITASAGAEVPGWSSGVNIIDVNGDGFNDIFICRFLLEDESLRSNVLLINNGDLTFTDRSAEYGLHHTDYSIMALFIDIDNDGDLDLYVANQPPNFRHKREALGDKIDYTFTDRLYENINGERFEEITDKAGITNFSYSLSATACDFNHDGFTDIYVAADYEEPDKLYMNNGNGTFTNTILEATRHIPNFSMGADVADINNDGWPDLFVADMVAEDNKRIKTNMSGMAPEVFYGLVQHGYHYQYMYNALQLNQGNGVFSEIAQLSGVSNTDWSWSPLFFDANHDGYRDLFVTNGLKRDMRDNDYNIRTKQLIEQKTQEAKNTNTSLNLDLVQLINMAPSTGIANYAFQNMGDLTFANHAQPWGLDRKILSHGSAYADLDGDGDLDLVLNNMDTIASIYENTINDNRQNHYLRIRLNGIKGNQYGLGSRIRIHYGNQMQCEEVTNVRGYMSCSEPIAHFGFNDVASINRVEIIWPDNKTTILKDVKTDQLLEVNYQTQAGSTPLDFRVKPEFFEHMNQLFGSYNHIENSFYDFKREILMPHMMSTLGPKVAVADVNNDGLEDLYIGGPIGFEGTLFLQQSNGTFKSVKQNWSNDAIYEDLGACFFDANGDGHPDLYVVSGGNERTLEQQMFRDRLYLNDGKGNFNKDPNATPSIQISGSCAIAADFDGDGQIDLFVGGRQVPGKWPSPTSSMLLKNENGKLINLTSTICPELENIGMVTDARWHDMDGDGFPELILVGEWMPVTIFKNKKGKLTKMNIPSLENTRGWWNCIELADLTGDGNMDFIAGNLGTNIKYKTSHEEPFQVFADDFDDNGTFDIYLGYYQDGKCFPVRGRECSSQQMPFVKAKFPSYDKFSEATIYDVIGSKAETALNLKADVFETVVFRNKGNFEFEMIKLHNKAQFSTVQSIIVHDFNQDGIKDILLSGNYYEREVETTRSDASMGLLMLGDGKMNFEPVTPYKSGFYARGNARDMVLMNVGGKPVIIVANNSGAIESFRFKQQLP
jgi:enediyne biosynthesis protein E4